MNFEELQKWVEEDWKHSSEKRPDRHLQLLYLVEELGEVMEAIRMFQGDKERKNNKSDIEEEMGDLVIALTTIANNYGISLTRAIRRSRDKIVKRHKYKKQT
ncbi:MAG: hypothetical protein KGJ58_00105 [Patescibacteria group bacterium]|nr:hypothetical protein [Patescibacteria group bacterium]MDE2217846.1 hypothetical protein [Patescibacteria group bacterium]